MRGDLQEDQSQKVSVGNGAVRRRAPQRKRVSDTHLVTTKQCVVFFLRPGVWGSVADQGLCQSGILLWPFRLFVVLHILKECWGFWPC